MILILAKISTPYRWLISLFILLIFTVSARAKEPKIVIEIDRLCHQYQTDHAITGLAVAIIGSEKGKPFEHLATFGVASQKSSVPITPYTEFRIGPLTKLFTANILAYFIQSGQVRLSDPISSFLSKSMTVPTYRGKAITLKNLATHTSGLPNFPYSNFRTAQMYRLLSLYQLKEMPGSSYKDAPFDYAVLANLLSRIGKCSFPELTEQIILTPLNLSDTTFSLSSEQQSRYAIGYQCGQGISPLKAEKMYATFIGAGGLYSTIRDMSTYLSFQLGQEQTSLNSLLPLMHFPHYQGKTLDAGLAWQISPLFDQKKPLLHLQGGFCGFNSYMGILPEEGIGVVLLSNKEEVSLNALGQVLLKLLCPLALAQVR